MFFDPPNAKKQIHVYLINKHADFTVEVYNMFLSLWWQIEWKTQLPDLFVKSLLWPDANKNFPSKLLEEIGSGCLPAWRTFFFSYKPDFRAWKCHCWRGNRSKANRPHIKSLKTTRKCSFANCPKRYSLIMSKFVQSYGVNLCELKWTERKKIGLGPCEWHIVLVQVPT